MRKLLFLLTLVAAYLNAQAPAADIPASPAPADAQRPNWTVTPDGSPLLNWLEPAKNGEFTLKYAIRGKEGWSQPRTVIANRSFFRHPAEVPAVAKFAANVWLAHWVEQGEEEAEFLYVSASTDGIRWTPPARAHKDTKPVQHGLVSLVQSGPLEASLFWLETPEGEDGPAYLMRSLVTTGGKFIREERLDSDVCSCCPTAVAKTTKGLLVAYRDHTAQDVRDPSVIRFEAGKWSEPKNVHADGWKLNACPINGPALAAKGDHVALAWFTGANDAPKVQVAISQDGGATFKAPMVLSVNRANGFPAVAMKEDGSSLVAWVEQGGENARLMLARVSALGHPAGAIQIAEGERAAFGYPKLVHSAVGDFIAWGASKLQVAEVK